MKYRFIDEKDKKPSYDYSILFINGNSIDKIDDVEVLKMMGFEEGSVVDLPSSRKVYVSVSDMELETIRLAAAKAVKAIAKHDIKSVFLAPPIASDEEASIVALVEGFELSSYEFNKYKSKKVKVSIEEVIFDNVSSEGKSIDPKSASGIDKGVILAGATNYVRDIVNEMPQVYTPLKMEEDAKALADSHANITVESFGRDYLREEGMNAFLAVGQSSPNEPKLIHLTYIPSEGAKEKYAFVGKGVTYDSGGLSLKPNSSMIHMKSDKGGAAAALGIIKAAAELNLPFEVHSVLGCTENMIGSSAYKPDDIIVSRSKVTIEVLNTDAEGRLVLADCLSWAQDKIKPDYIVDLATLTGACVVGLGSYTTGILGKNFDLQMDYKLSSKQSGELGTVLESNPYLEKSVESSIADIKNVVINGTGGSITAGIFLSKFIKKEYEDKWLHLDIAGPAFAESEWGYNPVGGTGAGVRANIYYLMEKAK